MNFKIKEINNFTMTSWDSLVAELDGPLQNCTYNNLNFYSSFEKIKNISIAVYHENKLTAIFPMAVNLNYKKIKLSFGNNLIFSPVFFDKITPSFRKRIYNYLFNFLKKKFNLKKLKIDILVSSVYFKNNKATLSSKNQFELMRFSKHYIVHNTLIIDLEKDENELLSNMSKYHRRNIIRASKIKNLKLVILDNKDRNDVKKKFTEFRKYHKISAGRVTRPLKTWKIMLKKILDNEADLFSLKLDNKIISYLYCSKLYNFAWGWSQVNLKEYEYLSPRHILEWNAMKYYKNNQFKFYEIGELFFEQKNFKPTLKEKTISEFKEKFGSDMYPKVVYNIEV
tara:strand:- start:1080 stop:2096 length:1017 start_codon:yes stop_codon:yes gene_type:complete